MAHKVFAYGSLKDYSTMDTHFVLGKLYEISGLAKIPGMKQCDCRDSKVFGQVIEGVSDELLANLDKYEGHPYLYKRQKVYVQKINGTPQDALVAWVYVYQPDISDSKEITMWPVQS